MRSDGLFLRFAFIAVALAAWGAESADNLYITAIMVLVGVAFVELAIHSAAQIRATRKPPSQVERAS